jgi:hypothetical protein
MSINTKNYWVEIFLGLGLGLGFLTSLRLAGPVGIPEILVVLALLLLINKNPYLLLRYRKNKESFFKAYIVFSNVIILPLVTCVVVLLSNYKNGSSPQYVLSFIIGMALMFYLADAILKDKINMPVMVLIFAGAFIISNLIAIYFFGGSVGAAEDLRYRGGAENPNQLIFYAATLSLLAVVYLRSFSFILVPAIIFIVLKTKSDAYNLMLFVILFCYVFFVIFFTKKISFVKRLFWAGSFMAVVLLISVVKFGEEIGDIWLAADEGDGRVLLMMNALKAVYHSPLMGLGAGSFSGLDNPFEGSEAHNTFLDFAVQFGIVYPLFLYWMIFKALFISLRRRQILVSVFIMGFIVSGFFHFTARHFVFWVELAVLYCYAFYSDEKYRSKNITQRAI